MFTGIIEEVGRIKAVTQSAKSIRLTIACSKSIEGIKLGDSIAVNGICLTAALLGPDWFAADVMPETLRRTGLHQLGQNDTVNLERALRFGDRLGGHLVSGHIDGTGKLSQRIREDNAIWLMIETPSELLRYIVPKGSVTLDGVSLTVAKVDESSLSVSLIPHTANLTILGSRKVGDLINIECDIIGKYVEKLLQPSPPDMNSNASSSRESTGISLDFLKENGFT